MNTVFIERASPNPMNKWPPKSWSVHLLYWNRSWYDSIDNTKTIYKTSCSHCILNRKDFLWFILRGFKGKEREVLTQEEPQRMIVVLRILVLARQKLLLQLWKSCLIVIVCCHSINIFNRLWVALLPERVNNFWKSLLLQSQLCNRKKREH